MFSKFMAGGLAAALAALGIVFWLLMGAKEANGKLASDIDRVAAANQAQKTVIGALKDNQVELIAQVERERKAALAASEAQLTAEQDREQAEIEFQARLAAAVSGLTPDEKECADEMVPAALINSLTSSLRN